MISKLRNRILQRKSAAGFTLVELAIVLAVTGVLFVGLYRLLSGGNQQVKDSAAASQQIQLINSVKTFLASSNGEQWMGGMAKATGLNDTPVTTEPLPLPDLTKGTCAASLTAQDTSGTGLLAKFCDSLPTGFSTATVNSFGQTYLIQVQIGPITHPATTPSTYSFMVMTIATGATDPISDADGGRISSEIGADGGFIYTDSAICEGASKTLMVCGSYGAWTASPTTDYGFSATVVTPGQIASRTYYSPESSANDVWLARSVLPNDPNKDSTIASPLYNTMTAPLFLGSSMPTYMGGSIGKASGNGSYLQLQNGTIRDPYSLGNSIQLFPNGPSFTNGAGSTINYLSISGNKGSDPKALGPMLAINSYCTVVQDLGYDPAANPSSFLHWNTGDSPSNTVVSRDDSAGTNDCPPALVINGDVAINGELESSSLHAITFVYTNSDRRLKTDIEPITGALDTLTKLQPVSFAFKANHQKGLGFIAQDLEKIYPILVTPHEGDGMKAVNYEGLVAPLVEAVQELKAQNDDLRQQLQRQAKRQDDLDKKLTAKAH